MRVEKEPPIEKKPPFELKSDPVLALHALLRRAFDGRRCRVSNALIERLVADVWAVQLGLRFACLLDGVAISEELACEIGLRLKDIRGCEGLFVLHERFSSSTFICSKSWEEVNPLERIFVDLSSAQPKILDRIPNAVDEAFSICKAASRLQSSGPVVVELGPPSTLVSLAGLLLGYPSVYCNCPVDESIGGMLKVVHVDLVGLTGSHELASDILPIKHRLMSFSFHAEFDRPGSPLELKALMNRLGDQIRRGSRLGIGFNSWEKVEVYLSQTVNLERVAL